MAIPVPDGMPIDYAEQLARVLLSKQSSGLFPDYQEFGQTADRRLVIRGLGDDFLEVQKFSGKLHRKFAQAMAMQRVHHRSRRRQIAYQMWLERLAERLEKKPSPEEKRRDKRITLALIVLMAALFSAYAYAYGEKSDETPGTGFWHCHDPDDAGGRTLVQLVASDFPPYMVFGGKVILADHQLDGLDHRWALMRPDTDENTMVVTGKEIFMRPDGLTYYVYYGDPPKNPATVLMVFKCVEVEFETAQSWSRGADWSVIFSLENERE